MLGLVVYINIEHYFLKKNSEEYKIIKISDKMQTELRIYKKLSQSQER